MPVSEARKKANAKWNKSRDNIMIRPSKEDGAKIRMAAESRGISVTELILKAVMEYIK